MAIDTCGITVYDRNKTLEELTVRRNKTRNTGSNNGNRRRRIHNHLHVNRNIQPSVTPMGLSPRELYDYYNFPSGYTGVGKTIAIVDAYNYPTAQADLRKFSIEFSLPEPNMQIYYPQGIPEVNASWSLEAALDLQWSHAMAPCARIMLVLAADDSYENLFDAVDFAVSNGADIVSMSWGAPEYSGEVEFESTFRNRNAIFVASAGDVGGITEYPSASRYVISVGGTRLNFNMIGNIVNESAWSNSGGGPSQYIQMPSWQNRFGLSDLTGGYRSTPDVAFDASPESGVSVYHTNPNTGTSNWVVVGGTSLAAPSWAGIIASVFRRYTTTAAVNTKLYNLAGGTGYTNENRCFHDITTGSAGNYVATEGYDFITGLGSPDIGNIIDNL